MPLAPVTFLHEFDTLNDRIRPLVMREFASNGAKYLVLTDTLIKQILGKVSLERQLMQEMAAEGLEFMDAHAPFGPYLDLNCPIPEARKEMIFRHKLTLQIIASMGVKTITIHTGNDVAYPDYPLEVQFDAIKHSLDELLPLAEFLGITICIENIWFKINTPERLLAIKECFPTDALGFCYDAGHANLMDKGRNFPESNPFKAWGDVTPAWDNAILEKMLPHVVNCHLHDNNGISDQHLNIGCGTVDWQHIVSLLKKAPRLKVVQSEVLMSRPLAVRELCETFNKLWN